MSDTVLVVTIIAVAVLIMLFIFRRLLKRFLFSASKEELKLDLETRDPAATNNEANKRDSSQAGVHARDNSQWGIDNSVDIEHDRTKFEKNKQRGIMNRITIKSKTGK